MKFVKMTDKLEKYCHTNDEFCYDADNTNAKCQRKNLRRSLRLYEKLANKENTESIQSNLNKSKIISKKTKMDKENDQKGDNINHSVIEIPKKGRFTEQILRSQTSCILPDFENMLVACQIKKPPIVASNVRNKRINAVLKSHGGNYGKRVKCGKKDSALLEVVLINSKAFQDNSKNKQVQTNIETVLDGKLIEAKGNIQQLQVDSKIFKGDSDVVKQNEQTSADNTELLDKSTQTKQTKRLPTAGLSILSASGKRYKPTRYGKIYRQSIWRSNAAFNSSTYSEQLKSLSKFEKHIQLRKQFARKRRAANKCTSILPDAYPYHFKFELTNCKTVENPIGNGHHLQISPEAANEANALKAGSPSALSLTSSPPSLPESLRGVFETDNIGELLHVERIVYRLNDFHVKVLAEVLDVKIDYLNAILDTIVDLAHPEAIQNNQTISPRLENAKTTEDTDEPRDDSSVIFCTP